MIATRQQFQRLWTALVLGLVSVSVVVLTATRIAEADRMGLRLSWTEIALLEGLSHLTVALIATTGGFYLFRRLDRAGQPQIIRHLVAGYPIFVLGHVAITFGLRALLFPLVLGRTYELHPFRLDVWLYEAPKDLLAYALLATAWLLLHRAQVRPAAVAQAPGRITLRADGVEHLVPVRDVIVATAAGNYVEVETTRRRLFVRMTLSALEAQMAANGGRAVRIHRSHLVNIDHIISVRPTGEGDVVVELSTGQQTPGSRRYRARLTAATQAPAAVQPSSVQN